MASNFNRTQAHNGGRAAARRCVMSAAAFAAFCFAPLGLFAAPPAAFAADGADQSFAMHGQATYVEQEAGSFTAPYAGANSLSPNQGRETTDATLSLGARLWSGAEGWIAAEIDQGFGLDATLGVAGFPSAEAYKVGRNSPYLRLPRVFVRQTVNLGAPTETVDADQMQLAGRRSSDRWVFTVGKFGVTDIFDTNQYAHDARNDFFNWTAVDAATFDYAADAWAYTVGAAAERYQGSWTARAGLFDLSTVPNSTHLDPGFHEFQIVWEFEHRHEWGGQPGRLLLTGFDTRGRMGRLDAAIALARLTGTTPNTADVRTYGSRVGLSLDLEQQLSADLGLFARIGKAPGNVEVYEFTDVDRSICAGLSLKGSGWGRRDDTIGIAGIVNGISAEREQYFNDGGLGILVGDGRLPHPGAEQIIETYYSIAVLAWAHVSLDYQWVKNPGYNMDRGPAPIFAVRVHAQF
ncbi:MAG TPA: carbohydrate porin [Steroidobacteraceae bacterium]|nr:carbohydrate porin [Steroidobacteraceae bacterium]